MLGNFNFLVLGPHVEDVMIFRASFKKILTNSYSESVNPCNEGFDCINTFGSFVCSDINECQNVPDVCPSKTFCLNSDGGYKCIDPCDGVNCSTGFVSIRSQTSCECVDVDECRADGETCPSGTICQNYEGGHKCNDIDECRTVKNA